EVAQKRGPAPEDDAILRELRRIIEVRTEQMARIRLLAEQGRATAAEVQEAEAKIAEAKIELARRSDELARPKQDVDALMALKSEQEALLMDIEDQRMRRTALEDQVARERVELEMLEKQYAEIARATMSAEEIEFDLALARKRYEEAAGEVDALRRRRSRLTDPRVIILEPAPERPKAAQE
ncbi:MAG: hypothetical protein JXP34_04055, partial [Planctomycetes bacterium]|nr:hypothetical protein [Planctomycetota bacterium]